MSHFILFICMDISNLYFKTQVRYHILPEPSLNNHSMTFPYKAESGTSIVISHNTLSCRSGFINLGNINTLGWIVLVVRGCLLYFRMFLAPLAPNH